MEKRTGVLSIFLAVCFFQIGIPALCQRKETLLCFNCTLGKRCLEPSLVSCNEGERCGTIKGLSDFKVHESIYARGCIPATKCNKLDRAIYSDVPYRVKVSCCDSNLCNGSNSQTSATFFLLVATTTVAILLAACS
ncbi:lymphocyte antigen 6 complex locus protein G6d-like [Pantherophis guttatus]|uniref:Lymphocyte antigen 6 complex locus protein G6d-like n=1 Tax=Pantherophis guttatus TaxID=94885 RepID=A0A6P9CCR4_PANGU|nr:lymphocyte antigen 6 complex locus protein G6d-like [Pantherophis guttatus]